MANSKPKLNDRQRLFVKHYIATLNAAESARRAGYSVKTAAEMGHENLGKPHIQEAIAKAVATKMEKAEVSGDQVIAELSKLAMMDGEELEQWAEKYGMRVSDKTRSLELLGKYHTLFTDRVEHSGEITINVSLDDDEEE
jgi:phage terminase small subunit